MSVVIKGDSNVNLDFTTGGRITGDFSNATIANRVMFQSSTTNGATGIIAIPNGTGVDSAWRLYNSSDTANASVGDISISAAAFEVRSFNAGTGTNLPMTFSTAGSERVRIDTSGNLMIGGTTAYGKTTSYTNFGNAYASNYTARALGTAQGQLAGYSFNPTFQATADNVPRRAADIWSGFNGGAWGTEFLAFGVGTGAANDAGNATTERMRITGSGDVGIGTSSPSYKLEVASTNSVVASRGTGGYGSFYAVGSGTNSSYLFLGNAGGEKGRITSNDDGTLTFGNGTSSTERARITAGGEVYIAGTTDQGAYNLQVNGTGVWGAGAYVNGSDERLKDNIQTLNDGLSVVNQLRPVTFQYKPEHSKDQSVQPGFIAQELQQAMAGKDYVDGVVQSGPEYLNVAYQNLIPILTKAIQEQQAIIESLTARITALEAK